MSKKPLVPEQEFLKLTQNHAEFSRKLLTIGTPVADVLEHAKYVCACWFRLALEHLEDAKVASASGRVRASYSRAYYAVYNASKATRYLVTGTVSLKADDHGKASTELPDDFPNSDQWSAKIVELYAHRLRADYDNWSDTVAGYTLAPADTIAVAEKFVDEVRKYLKGKFGMSL